MTIRAALEALNWDVDTIYIYYGSIVYVIENDPDGYDIKTIRNDGYFIPESAGFDLLGSVPTKVVHTLHNSPISAVEVEFYI